ncbi:hypothetical protein GIB67_012102 [Kingdonia uniflora]|uniref:Uncharacterized protein n=1 Tax=Kingdonia uniflora TaxID=39325 RepID=A0A7J7LHZ2_9MAGN|nr:hypothetical protein GIB67_012102 [Kingdonia uniflora]
MASISGCAKDDEVDLVGQLTPIIGVGDEEDTVAKLIEWPRLNGSRVEYPTGSSQFREFCKAKSSIDGIWGHPFAYRVYGLTLPLRNLAKSVMNLIGACPAQLNCNFWEVILVCETLNGRWAASGSENRITAKDFLEYYALKYVTVTHGAYLSSSSSRPCLFDLPSAGPVWNDNLLWVSGINYKVSRKESFIDVVARKGTELKAILKELEISRFKRVASKDDKVRRSQVKRRLAGKTSGSMEEKLSTPELNTPLKITRLNEILDGPVDMATVSSSVVWNLAKRKAIKGGLLLAQFCRSVWTIAVRGRRRGELSSWREKEREAAALKLKEVRAESKAEADRLVTASAISQNNLAGKLYQLRYIKAEIMAFCEGNYEEMDIMDEKEVEEKEDGLNVAEKTDADNQETINQKELDVAREREEQNLLYNAEYAEEYEVLISQHEDRLDDNVKLFLKLEEAKRQVEKKITIILSKDLVLNQLTSELPELKEKVASVVEERENDLDTARTNFAVSEANFEKMSSSIMGKDRELHNSAQICDSLIARLDHVKADLRRLKGREAQSRADLAEIQAKNGSLVYDLAYACRNVRRAVQREKEMNERINQLCVRISELERELRVCQMKHQKDLKFELDKRDGEVASGEGSQEMKEFLRRKEELVENMRIDVTNSRQKSIDLTRQMSERIDQITAELAQSNARRLKDNKRAAVTHQAFKEPVVHEQEKCDGEALHQRQLNVLVTFFVEEIKFLQIERDLIQDCFSGMTCVCKLDISSIDPIGVMDRGIGTTTAEQIAQGREIIAERALEYMASRTKIGGSSNVISPTPIVGGWSTALPS